MNKSISRLLSRKRARNDASNQSEFLVNKHPRTDDDEGLSAARVDAKLTDRDAMMKFDIAKNDEGPLRRTVQPLSRDQGGNGNSPRSLEYKAAGDPASAQGGLDERLSNLEEHLALRYGTVLIWSVKSVLMIAQFLLRRLRCLCAYSLSKNTSSILSANTLPGRPCTLTNPGVA